MATPLILAFDSSLPEDVRTSSRELAASFATMLGETVLIVSGSSARMASGLKDCPVDAAVVGIVDAIEIKD